MNADEIRHHLDRRPFVPVRICLSTGVFYDIRQPALASVSRLTLEISFPPEGAIQRFVVVALIHIVALELLFPAPLE